MPSLLETQPQDGAAARNEGRWRVHRRYPLPLPRWPDSFVVVADQLPRLGRKPAQVPRREDSAHEPRRRPAGTGAGVRGEARRPTVGRSTTCVERVNSSTLGTLAVLALTAAASPFSLIAFSLVLATERGTKNGIPFIAGWMTTVMLIGVAGLIIGGSASVSDGGSSSDAIYGAEIALGVVVLTMWMRRRLSAPIEVVVSDKPDPAWKRRITTMKAPGAFVLGGAVQTWPVMLAGVAEITHLGMSTADAVLWLFLFACATVTGVVILDVLALRSPGSAAARLDKITGYVDAHRNTVISWILLGGGIWLTARGIIGLVS